MSVDMFAYRDRVAGSVVLLLLMLLTGVRGMLVMRPDVRPPVAVQVRLVTLPKDAPKPVVHPPRPQPSPPRQPVMPHPQPHPRPQAVPVRVPAPAAAVAVAAVPVSTPGPVAAAPAPAPAAAAGNEAPAPGEDFAGEAGFARAVRERIEEQKMYPAAARQRDMQGVVELRYVIDRKGRLLAAEVVTSSGYELLDRAALRAVRSASFGAMADTFWPGEDRKEFRTRVVFKLVD